MGAVREHIRSAVQTAWPGTTIEWDIPTQEIEPNGVFCQFQGMDATSEGTPGSDYYTARYLIAGIFNRPTNAPIDQARYDKLDSLRLALTNTQHIGSSADAPRVPSMGDASDFEFGRAFYAASLMFEVDIEVPRGP